VRSFTVSGLHDTENIVPFENITPINQNKKVKIKERRADWSDQSKWHFRRVQCSQCRTIPSQ